MIDTEVGIKPVTDRMKNKPNVRILTQEASPDDCLAIPPSPPMCRRPGPENPEMRYRKGGYVAFYYTSR